MCCDYFSIGRGNELLVSEMLWTGLVVLLAGWTWAAPHWKVDPIVQGTELEFAFMIHRHGDRTPVKGSMSISNDPEALMRLSQQYGLGQLTTVGKQRSYALGKEIRKRYHSLLGDRYNVSQIYIRSTDSTRTKMTVLAAMAAVYPPGDKPWIKDLNWEPVPYTTVPAKNDHILANVNCPAWLSAASSVVLARSRSRSLDQYSEVFDLLKRKSGLNVKKRPILAFTAYNLYSSQLSLGLPLDPEVQAVYPEIQKAAGEALDLLLGDNTYSPLHAGVLLHEFLTYSKAIANGESTQKIRIYSGHDINVYAFEVITQVANRLGVPKFSALYSLELRRVTATGEFIVLPVYIPSPGEEPMYLQISGCDQFCTLERFIEITSPYARDEESWRADCGHNPNIFIDKSIIA